MHTVYEQDEKYRRYIRYKAKETSGQFTSGNTLSFEDLNQKKNAIHGQNSQKKMRVCDSLLAGLNFITVNNFMLCSPGEKTMNNHKHLN